MQKKYQVFISSTYTDLKEQRDAVMKSCLQMGHIPIGMEMFNPADEEQWQIITRTIDSCDYYCVIVAQRYGSMMEGISYTEKEYDYASSIGVPVLRFMLDEQAPWPPASGEQDPAIRQALNRFKDKLKTKIVAFWKSTEDLQFRFAAALPQAINLHPRPGWIRVDDHGYENALAEIARLSRENGTLKEENERYAKANPNDQEGRLAYHLMQKLHPIRTNKSGTSDIEDFTLNYGQVFLIIAQTIPNNQFVEGIIENIVRHAAPYGEYSSLSLSKSAVIAMLNYYVMHGLLEKSKTVASGRQIIKYDLTQRGNLVLYHLETEMA